MSTPEFTGERFIPGKGGSRISYEHLHRYLYSSKWARSKRVLDVATGAGYGAALLSGPARLVYAMDIDEETVRYARAAWNLPNLAFFRADAGRIPLLSGSVDLAVAMEVLEHLEDQDGMMSELARVCSPAGVALISTPNKASYTDARGYINPFHVHEFYRDEFLALLRRHFAEVRILFQQIRAGSLITSDAADSPGDEILTSPAPEGSGPAVEPMYFLAICCQRKLDDQVPHGSAYLDVTDSLLLEWETRHQGAIDEIAKLNAEIDKLGEWGRELAATIDQKDRTLRDTIDRFEAELEGRDRTILDLQEDHRKQAEMIRLLQEEMLRERERLVGERERLLREVETRDGCILRQQKDYDHLRAEFDSRGEWAKALEARIADRDALLDKRDTELRQLADHIARIRHAQLYRILCRLGLLPE